MKKVSTRLNGVEIATRVDDKLFSMLQDDFKKYGGQYNALRMIIKEYYENKQRPEEAQALEDIEKTGNVIEDSKNLAASEIPSNYIKRIVADIDNQKKLKNSMKKGGAFHEENALIDLISMIKYGKPTFSELNYFFNYWYNMAVCLNALALRGNRMTKIQRQTLADLENPIPNANAKSTLEDSVKNMRVNRSRKK